MVQIGFMPIVVEGVALEEYISWISNKIENLATKKVVMVYRIPLFYRTKKDGK